jgi:hypothetical protein
MRIARLWPSFALLAACRHPAQGPLAPLADSVGATRSIARCRSYPFPTPWDTAELGPAPAQACTIVRSETTIVMTLNERDTVLLLARTWIPPSQNISSDYLSLANGFDLVYHSGGSCPRTGASRILQDRYWQEGDLYVRLVETEQSLTLLSALGLPRCSPASP